jgi:hypothetical protein
MNSKGIVGQAAPAINTFAKRLALRRGLSFPADRAYGTLTSAYSRAAPFIAANLRCLAQ